MKQQNKKSWQTVLGFDFGTRSIGYAIAQSITKTAEPLGALTARKGKPDWIKIAQLITIWQPNIIVVGIPYNFLNKDDNATTKLALAFVKNFKKQFQIDITTIDESLSSHEAKSMLFNTGKKLTKANIDATAAQFILQSWVDEN